jgi:hypothetical protein
VRTPTAPRLSHVPPPWVIGAFLCATALLCVGAPLLTYSVTLAAFGLAHVLSELRYVGARFGTQVARRLWRAMCWLLIGVIAVRLVRLGHIVPLRMLQVLEGLLVMALVAIVLPTMRHWGGFRLLLGVSLATALGFGALLWPVHTLLFLAVVHNLTPIGFLAEVTPRERRLRTVGIASVLFIGVPLFIATGWPYAMMSGIAAPDLSLLPTGALHQHYGVYLPKAWAETDHALHLFSGVVFAQCMHYAVVIHVLPRMLPEGPDAPEPWPARRPFLRLLLITGVALFALFTLDFGGARGVYGIAAAVHAWIELPILLLAMGPANVTP